MCRIVALSRIGIGVQEDLSAPGLQHSATQCYSQCQMSVLGLLEMPSEETALELRINGLVTE